MSLRQEDFESILADAKTIDGDIIWQEDEDHSPAVEFRADVHSTDDWTLFVCGSYNTLLHLLSYVLILTGTGRIYALDLGKDHRNPDGTHTGDKHKHRYDERYRDKVAYVPEDITATASEPLKVWQQFCQEAKIIHNGVMHAPPFNQGKLW